MQQRIKRLRHSLEQQNLDGIIVDSKENIYYLTGFTGGADARVLLTMDESIIFTDARYTEQVKREAPDWTLVEEKPPPGKALLERLRPYINNRIGLEDTVSYRFFQQINETFEKALVPVSGVVEELRMVKDQSELDYLRQAAAIGNQVFNQLLAEIKAGMKERTIANAIISGLRDRGCEKESFDPIAVSGPNAALPHGVPGERILQPGDMLTLDFGGFYRGYAGDMTRTVAIDCADQRLRDLYQKLLEAQQLGVEQAKAGMSCAELDGKVRECLKKYDLDQYFVHGTGHGLGLEVHEQPTVSSRSTQILQAGMVITIEPGIYIPGWGGIRIEDSVIINDYGCEIISRAPKELIII